MRIQFTIVAEPKKPVSRVCTYDIHHHDSCLFRDGCYGRYHKYNQVWLRLDGGDGGEGRERTVGHILNIQVRTFKMA